MARGARGSPAAPAKKVLDPPIFERVERHYSKASSGFQQLLGGHQPAIEFAELVIDGDPQCLERPGSRILPWLGLRYCRTHDLGEFDGAANGPALPRGHNRASYSPREPFLAESAYQLGELRLGQFGQYLRRTFSCSAHSHVERPVCAK
jgi:hypothetical protein